MRSAAAEPEETFARMCCWSRVTKVHSTAARPHLRHARQSATPVRHDNSATEYHNAYAIDPTVYAATYTASTGASPMGQVKAPFGQRVYSAMKRIREEILNHCSTISVFLIVKYTSLLGPSVGVQHLCTRPPCAIKGGHPLENDSSPAGQRIDSFILRAIHHTVDVGYYAPAARTTLNPCVLAFLPPS